MTVEEFRNLKVGDMIEFNTLVYELKEIKSNRNGRVFDGCTPMFIVAEHLDKPYEIVYRNSSSFVDCVKGFYMFKKLSDRESFEFKYSVRIIRENELKYLIPEKEKELENLKKEYEEIKQKNVLDRIVPGNVYRFTLCDRPNIILYVREISEHKVYTVNITNDTWGNFYRSEVTNVEHLPELTEAYKNIRDLLEKT